MKMILAGVMLTGILTTAAMGQGERRQKEPKPAREADKRPRVAAPQEMFKRMDQDGDGEISKREFFTSPRIGQLPEKQRNALFGRLDRDGSGSISREEIRKMRQQDERCAREDFRKLDADHNGSVSFVEFSGGEFIRKLPVEKRRQIFKRMDSNGDGEISGADRPKGPPGKPKVRPERKRKQ